MPAQYPLQRRLEDGRPLLITGPVQSALDDRLHRYREGQLWAVRQGVITAELDTGSWVVPARRIGWIPPGVAHAARVHNAATGCMIYLRPDLCPLFPTTPTVFDMTPLSSALLERIAQWCEQPGELSAPQNRHLDVLFDELKISPAQPLFLPMPSSPHLVGMTLTIVADPADKTSLDDWARRVGMSRRGLTRHFRAETGMSLVQWRIVARMKRAVELLAHGDSVNRVAQRLGYDSVSTFITAFSAQFGATPGTYAL
ncbi:helix-turn-helix transcriptional regulator [Pseudomonas sp. GD03842]|uniref:helix-turn-helix transcriptional regulator n=1 Tax=Pseudomonas sp. GD03842 TaxID=2975385 RepID=UPI002448013F|nr:helix-turn-helix transcriptional regulator [Pseudomonas sp. GD03842]MDH0747578.1 helix-turn-helix transcriptional regulator [Pseudomonas sp. GD03842]